MHETRRNILVGVFVLFGLGAMAALVVLFGQGYGFGLRSAAYLIDVRFDHAAGVKEGTLVNIGGIEVGRVDHVEFVDAEHFEQGVNVTVRIDEKYKIPQGSIARTSEPGLGMGRPPITIVPGPAGNPALTSGAVIPGRMSAMTESLIPQGVISTFDRTATQLGEAAAALKPVLEDMHELMQARSPAGVDQPGGPQGNLSSAMARLDTAIKGINAVLADAETQNKLRATVDNLHKISEDGKALAGDLKTAAADIKDVSSGAKELVGKVGGAVDRTDQRIDELSRSLRTSIEQASEFLTQLNSIASKANRGEGTIGKLVTDDRLYEAMTVSFRRLGETVEEFKLLIKDWQQGKIKIGL
ncbi:MAG: MCE family protein [Planctomycetes bacterium]|nr:MCE family protein [Planctomycetota bacterium]